VTIELNNVVMYILIETIDKIDKVLPASLKNSANIIIIKADDIR
jgi:hypothetical protein